MKSPDKLLAEIRRTLVKVFPERAEEMRGWHPVVQMAVIAADDRTPVAIKYTATAEVAKYTTAKPAAVDGEGNVAPVLEVRIAGYAQALPMGQGRLNGAAKDAD